MKKITENNTLFRPIDAANKAADLNQYDDDWEYRVVDHDSGWSSIEVYERDTGEYVGKF